MMTDLFHETEEEVLGEVSETIQDPINGYAFADSTTDEVATGFQSDEVIEQIRMLDEKVKEDRWQISDLVSLLTLGCTNAKERNSVVDYIAVETNIESVTVKQYDWMARAYPTGPIREISPTLTWSHYRTCAGCDTIEERREWLEKANDNNWSVQMLKEQLAQARETEAINLGTPCSRMGCTCQVSAEPLERVIVNAYGYKIVCCSAACATNILVNTLMKVKAKILGEDEPVDGMTPLIVHPDKEKRDTTSHTVYEKLRNQTEREIFGLKKQKEKKR